MAEDFYGKITKVVILNDIVPSLTTAGWFGFLEDVSRIEGLEKLNTENVTDMSYMFWCDENLTSLDISNFMLSSTTNMEDMFYKVNCKITINNDMWTDEMKINSKYEER